MRKAFRFMIWGTSPKLFTAFWLTVLCLSANIVSGEPTRRLALMVGVNDGGRDRVRLQYAVSDAATFAGSMRELGGVEAEDILLLREASVEAMEAAFISLHRLATSAKRNGERVEIVVFYSGHADEQGLLLHGQHFSFDRFRSKVHSLPAEVRIAVVDACASGALIKRKGGRAIPTFLADESRQAQGYAFLTSSSSDEAAQESDRIRASYFSHFLNTGLRGAADASQDGRITLHEAYAYAYRETLDQTERSAAGPQHASYDMNFTGSGDVVMTELQRAQATLIFPDSLLGRFFIRDARNRLLAEVQKTEIKPVRLALEPGQYSVYWHHQNVIEVGNIILKKGDALQVKPDTEWKAVGKERTVSRGKSAFNPNAFGLENASKTMDSEDWDGNLEEESQYHWRHLKTEEDFRGMQFTWGFNQANRRFEGEQFAFFGNFVGSTMNGVQAAGLYNVALGQVKGGQVSSFANIAADDVRGLQFSTGINVARTMSQGVQMGSSFNYVGGSATGVQFCPFLNLTRGSFSGFQSGMGVNYVGSQFKGTQFLNVLNWVGGTVEGYQLGIINVAKSYRSGTPIGLLNFVGDGTWRGEAWMDETGFQHYGFISGSRVMNTRLALGQNTSTPVELGALTLEAAGHFNLTPGPTFFLEPGLMGTVMGSDEDESHAEFPDMLARLRLTLGVDIGPYISIAGGVSWACLFTPSDRAPLVGRMVAQSHYFDNQFHMWPGLHASIRIGTYGHL